MGQQSPGSGPTLAGLLPLVRTVAGYRALLVALTTQDTSAPVRAGPIPLRVLPAALPSLIACLHADVCSGGAPGAMPPDGQPTGRPVTTPPQAILVVVPRAEQAKRLRDEIALWCPDPGAVLHYPEPEAMPYERIPGEPTTVQQRLAVLAQLSAARRPHAPLSSPPIVVASVRAVLHPTVAPSDVAIGRNILQRGLRVELNELLQHWLDLGYQPATVVEEPGQFSRRGGILDIFPPSSENPVRVELFGDEIDSLRYFDPLTQRSLGPARTVAAAPATELLPPNAPQAARALAALDVSGLRSEAQHTWQADLTRLQAGRVDGGLEFYAPYFGNRHSLLDYFSGVVLLDSPDLLAETAAELHQQAESLKAQLVERGDLPAGFARPYLLWDELAPTLADKRVLSIDRWSDEEAEATGIRAPEVYAGRLKQMLDDCQKWAHQGQRVVLTSHQAKRLSALLAERGVTATPRDVVLEPPASGSITLVQGSAAEGWSSDALTLLSDAEIFGWVRPRRAARKARAPRELFLSELKPGDYVVHIEHGIGVFRGLEKMTLDGLEREYLHLDYAEGDRLFVPVEHVDRVTRYVGVGEARPTLTRLSSADWEHAKARVKQAVQNIAKELLALYAARETAPGYAFNPDTVWQHDLEASFPYLETPDQLAAIEEVKADMERRRPMDRLICGDVGYGKTEVALRAAFKAVMDGKQVAILVPTTILAQQHFNTFRERLAAFPVRVEMLSRFRTDREQHVALEGLKDGTVDIVIGTHRLLQKDVAFNDLGLVIIDEEQRFGVVHKERLKQLRKEVDVLTLTATPIPRTLHMSLAGVRDMSTIDTPPEERLPIVTIVREYDETLIREAILRERDRGGQVYFVHNRVHGIETVATRLQKLVPEATFVVGHGQMQEADLERVMLDFGEGRYDVLVCTAIIEAGLDIPNVNTIIVNRANHFGLAQLYQLRGRVGRGANRAYAYFLYDNEYQLSETAEKRLDVIREATDLGAGFRIAMRDLEIRGAGNLLGVEQHGHISAVGLDLYTRLLGQAVAELRELQGEEPTAPPAQSDVPSMHAPVLDLPLNAFLPPDYVSDDVERLALYQRMANLRTAAEVDALSAELRDRFGPLPSAAENLIYSLQVKVRAMAGKVASLKVTDDAVIVRLGPDALPDRTALVRRFGPALKQQGLHTLRLDRGRLGGKWREGLLRLVSALAEGE